MTIFSYSGRDKNGQAVSGALDAGTMEAAAQQLLAGGVYPISIDRKKDEVDEEGINFTFGKKVKADELIMLTRQLYSLTKAGVPLNKAIRSLSQTLKNKYLMKVLSEIERNLNNGITLSASMSRHVEIFPRLYVSMILVGENSGRLEEAFKQLVDHLELEKETARRIGGAFRYPMFVAIALGIAIVVLNIWVIPIFAEMFSQFGAELPLMTKFLIASSNFFVEYWMLLLIISVIGITLFIRWKESEEGRLKLDAFKLRIIVVGAITQKAVLARFCRTFAMMMTSGVPLLKSIELCSTAVGNAAVGEKIRAMKKGVERGEGLYQAIGNSDLFTPLVLQMVSIGEQTGNVDDMLNEVADFYDREVEYEIATLSERIEPLLIIFMTALVGVLAMGIFLPMWEMFSVVQG